MISCLLMMTNIGVLVLFIYQCWKGITETPSDDSMALLDKTKEVAVEAVVTECKKLAVRAIMMLGYEPEEASELRDQFLHMIDRITRAMEAMEDCEQLLDDLSAVAVGEKSPLEVLDSLISISVKILGDDETVELFEPVTGMLLTGAAATLQTVSCAKEITDKLEEQSTTLAEYIVQVGIDDFFSKWKDHVIDSLENCTIGDSATLGENVGEFATTVDAIIELFSTASGPEAKADNPVSDYEENAAKCQETVPEPKKEKRAKKERNERTKTLVTSNDGEVNNKSEAVEM